MGVTYPEKPLAKYKSRYNSQVLGRNTNHSMEKKLLDKKNDLCNTETRIF